MSEFEIGQASIEYLRYTGDGRVMCLWPDGRFVEVVEKVATPEATARGEDSVGLGSESSRPPGLHCPTCQCNKFPPPPPVPENPRSRSWHENALTKPK